MTAPERVGPSVTIRRRTIRACTMKGRPNKKVRTAFIIISEFGNAASRHTFSVVSVWEIIGFPPERDPGGSPFQMPARLADGLDHGSDRDNGSHCRSPHPHH